jgi:hypothetical protein
MVGLPVLEANETSSVYSVLQSATRVCPFENMLIAGAGLVLELT